MSACVDYEFRINKEFITPEILKDWLSCYAREWGFQLERSDTGYEHYQGHLKLVKKRRKNEVRTQCWTHEHWFGYFEPTCNNYRRMISSADGIGKYYATKIDTRIEGPWTSDDVETFVPEHVKSFEPYPWQEDLIANHLGKNDRQVTCIFDPKGGIGKSTLLTWLLTSSANADSYYQIPPINDSKDLMQAVCDQLMAKRDRNPKAIFIDLPRAMNKKCLAEMYVAIESIKDGYSYETRYKYRDWRFNRPSVVVFSNQMPDKHWLTPNRWNILGVNENNELESLSLN